MSAKVSDALNALTPGAEWSIADNDYNTLQWFSANIAKPTAEEVATKIEQLNNQAPFDACKAQAKKLLAETDWAFVGDMGNQLVNQAEFAEYRKALRFLAIYPSSDPVWPVKPVAVWSS